MTQNTELEITVIKRFVAERKKDRYIQFLASPKNRHKFISELSHFKDFQWDLFDTVKGNEEQTILKVLSESKITDTTCYVISENRDIDTQTLDIKQAIEETVGYGMATILVFGSADIIYFESEEMKSRFISKKVK